MYPNLRMRKEIAAYLKVPEHHLISVCPDPKLLRHTCRECNFWKDGVCDLGNGDRVVLPAICYSCKHFKHRKETHE